MKPSLRSSAPVMCEGQALTAPASHRPLAEAQTAFEDLVAGRAIRTVLDCGARAAESPTRRPGDGDENDGRREPPYGF